MAAELEGEPSIEYAIKLHLLYKLNGLNKSIKDSDIELFCRDLIK